MNFNDECRAFIGHIILIYVNSLCLNGFFLSVISCQLTVTKVLFVPTMVEFYLNYTYKFQQVLLSLVRLSYFQISLQRTSTNQTVSVTCNTRGGLYGCGHGLLIY